MNYIRVYEALTFAAKNRELKGYCERHHIVPRSFGGGDEPTNIVRLTAREHFIAHWLLFKIYKDAKTARAFRLLSDGVERRRSRDYALAKQLYAETMRGDSNPAKRGGVREKIRTALKTKHPFLGKKRPEHSKKMRGKFVGVNNHFYKCGDRQQGSKNHMARAVVGVHNHEVKNWDTLLSAANELGVSIQAVCQALRRKGMSRGWKLEYKNGI